LKALIIEDNKEIIESVSIVFRIHWPEVVVVAADSGEKGIELVETESPDVVILDIGLVDMDGFEVLRQIRLFSDTPVIILTGRAIQEIDRIKGFEIGADDYILKPFSPGEFLARVKNTVAHARVSASGPDVALFNAGNLSINFAEHEVRFSGNPVDLTPTEYRLLSHLARNTGRVLPYRNLLEVIWGEGYKDTPVLKTCVYRLRKKLVETGATPDIVTSEHAVGYKLNVPR